MTSMAIRASEKRGRGRPPGPTYDERLLAKIADEFLEALPDTPDFAPVARRVLAAEGKTYPCVRSLKRHFDARKDELMAASRQRKDRLTHVPARSHREGRATDYLFTAAAMADAAMREQREMAKLAAGGYAGSDAFALVYGASGTVEEIKKALQGCVGFDMEALTGLNAYKEAMEQATGASALKQAMESVLGTSTMMEELHRPLREAQEALERIVGPHSEYERLARLSQEATASMRRALGLDY